MQKLPLVLPCKNPATQVAQKLWQLECWYLARRNGHGCGNKGDSAQNLAKCFTMRDLPIFIPDQSGPGITTTVTSDLSPRVTGGHATCVQRRSGKQWRIKKKRNEERKKAKKNRLKVNSLNVGTMAGKGRRVADFMKRRRVDVMCV